MSPQSGRGADPENIIEMIHRTEQRAGYRGGENRSKGLDWNSEHDRKMVLEKFRENGDLDKPLLPGFGQNGRGSTARDDCGDAYPFGCPDCGNTAEIGRTCAQSVCARCGAAWARDAAIQKTAKIRRVRKEKHQMASEHQKTHHEVISPRLDWFYILARDGYTLEEAMETTREVVKCILDEQAAQGIVAAHPFRGKKDDGSVKSEEDDRGAWKERLNSNRKFYGDVRDELAWMPHYHAIVVSDFLRGDGFADVLEDKTGWVVHRIADDDGISLANDSAMARATTYTISHAEIRVNPDGNNRSSIWEVGSIDGNPIKSSPQFTPQQHDINWADSAVRSFSQKILGLRSTTTDCGAELPAVDDPDELAREVLDRMFPNRKRRDEDVSTDTVLYHISEGNIQVDVTTSDGDVEELSVRDAFGDPVPDAGWGSPGDLPAAPTAPVAVDGGSAVMAVQEENDDDCSCDQDHGNEEDSECDGTLRPFNELRERGLLEDEDWLNTVPHADQALETHREWPDDLEPWRTDHPGQSIGGGGG